jgi:hypothetical protein
MADAAAVVVAAPGPYTLGIESGLNYIQTQHRGECVYDSFQMILTFADGLRGINAVKAQEFFNTDPEGLLTSSASYKSQVGMFMFGVDSAEALQALIDASPALKLKRLINFYSFALRRYVLIKLQECGWTSEALESHFKISSGGIQTLCPGAPEFAAPVLKRLASLNTEGSTYAALNIMDVVGMAPKFTAGKIATEGSFVDQINAIAHVIFKLPILSSGFHHTTTYKGNDNLVGIAITAVQPRGGGHENCIVRYRGKYYYCDNEIGVAQEFDSELLTNLQTNSFSFGSEEGKGYFFKINDQVAYHDPERMIGGAFFVSNHLIYVYAKSEPLYGPEDGCSLIPPTPALAAANGNAAAAAAAPTTKGKFIAQTVLDGERRLQYVSQASRRPVLPQLRGTRRAGRPFLQFMESLSGASGGALGRTRRNKRSRR